MHDSIQLTNTTSSVRTSPVAWPNDNQGVGNCLHALLTGFRPASLILARRIAFPLLLLGAGLVLVQPCAGQSGTWSATGSLTTGFSNTAPTPTPLAPSQAQLVNISTRMEVMTGDNVLIGGFIVTGSEPKKVLLRAIGPSYSYDYSYFMADPVLELHAAKGSLIASNDNWEDTQPAEIWATGIAPADSAESAIVITLDPGNYTVIVSPKYGTFQGTGLVEVYDLDQSAASQLANISTRGYSDGAGRDVMIGGFILGNGTGTTNVLIRALGPSLAGRGVTDTMPDPILNLYDENGTVVMTNDNWKESQQAEIEATGIPPTNGLESAMVATLSATAHTAIVSASNEGRGGVVLVEVYRLP